MLLEAGWIPEAVLALGRILATLVFIRVVNLLVIGLQAQMDGGYVFTIRHKQFVYSIFIAGQFIPAYFHIVFTSCYILTSTWPVQAKSNAGMCVCHQVYVNKNGQELTGQIAYRQYKKVKLNATLYVNLILILCHLAFIL